MSVMDHLESPPSLCDDRPPQRPPRRYDSPIVPAWNAWLGLLALLLALTLTLFAQVIIYAIAGGVGVHVNTSNPPGGIVIIGTVVQDAIFVATAALLARSAAGMVSSSQFGFRSTRFWRALLLIVGMLIAFFVFSVIWIELLETTSREKLLEQLGTNEATSLLIGSAMLTCVIAPICEETLFRGFIFTSLRNWKGPWVSALITGLLFGLVHGASAPAVDLLPLAALGIGLCLLYRSTGSIYACIAAHSLNNSLAFGAQEGWGWQIPVLLIASLATIWLLVQISKAMGLISREGGEPVG